MVGGWADRGQVDIWPNFERKIVTPTLDFEPRTRS